MIEELITSKTRSKLLTIFLTNPKSRFFMRELARKTGEYINSVRQELNKLEEMGLINSQNIANLKYYSINKNYVIYNELRNIIIKTNPQMRIISQTLEALKQKFGKELSSVILFGSLARNELEFNDIDLLVIVKELPKDWRKSDDITIEIEKIGLKSGITLHIELLANKELEFSVNEGAPLLFEISSAYRVICDNGFFENQMKILRQNMVKWKARKIDKTTWEVPELAVKI